MSANDSARRGPASDEMRERIDRRRRHHAETRHVGIDERRRGAPVIGLVAPGRECPAHPGQDRYDCEVCAQ